MCIRMCVIRICYANESYDGIVLLAVAIHKLKLSLCVSGAIFSSFAVCHTNLGVPML